MRVHSARLLEEKCAEDKSSEQDHGTLPSRASAETDLEVLSCRLELDFTPLTVHTTCSCSRSKYPNEKFFRWRQMFVVE